jgi:hypothetical protein
MSISYSSSYLGILLDRNSNLYKKPSLNQLDSDQIVFDYNNYNIYSYLKNDGKVVKIAGNTWIDEGDYGSPKREGTGLHANTFNIGSENSSLNYPLGDYSSTFGFATKTKRNYEVAMGSFNIHAYAFHDLLSEVGTTPEPQMLFGIGNGTSEAKRSNIFSVTDHNVVVSGDSYVGFTWKQGNADASSYYLSSSSGNLTVAQGVTANTLTASKSVETRLLNVTDNAVLDTLYINENSYALTKANDYLPRQLNRAYITSGNYNYFYPIDNEQYNSYVSRLENEYTIDWIDFYESTFRDSICCFKAFVSNASGDEYSPYNASEYSSIISKLDWYINGKNTSKQFRITECYPVYVTNVWKADNYGSFQIKLQLNTTDSSHTSDTLYLRPCRETYKILAAIAGDVDGWFKNHTTTINGSSFRFRWSPLTQYQDSDDNQDPADVKTKLDFSTRSNHQIYFCIDEAKYYIKTYTGQLKEVDMGTCAPVDLSLK